MRRHIAPLVTALSIMVSGAAFAQHGECAKCTAYPNLCDIIEFCIKNCNVAPDKSRLPESS
jgi:hypothetical protein